MRTGETTPLGEPDDLEGLHRFEFSPLMNRGVCAEDRHRQNHRYYRRRQVSILVYPHREVIRLRVAYMDREDETAFKEATLRE